MTYLFRRACDRDSDRILGLYDSVRGVFPCTRNNEYPTEVDVRYDLSADCLFVLTADESVIGAVSVVPVNELDGHAFWHIRDGAREIARQVVSPAYRGHGLAAMMLNRTEDLLRSRGVTAVHLLAAVQNEPAVRLYEKSGYTAVCDRVSEFGHEYVAFEKQLTLPDGQSSAD